MLVHSMGHIYVHCCNVFSEFSQCGSVLINAFLQNSHGAVLSVVLRAVHGPIDATLCVCFVRRVHGVLRGRGQKKVRNYNKVI